MTPTTYRGILYTITNNAYEGVDMDLIAAEIIAKWGPVGILAVVVGILAFLGYKAERRLYMHEKKLNDHIVESEEEGKRLDIAFKRVDELKIKNAENTGKFDTVDSRLSSMDEKINKIGSGVQTIVDHFVKKGME